MFALSFSTLLSTYNPVISHFSFSRDDFARNERNERLSLKILMISHSSRARRLRRRRPGFGIGARAAPVLIYNDASEF